MPYLHRLTHRLQKTNRSIAKHVPVHGRGRDGAEHAGEGVASKRLLQDARELRVAVRNEQGLRALGLLQSKKDI